MQTSKERREFIKEILQRQNGIQQHEILDVLIREHNWVSTQATISRDLKALGAVRIPKGYILLPVFSERPAQVNVDVPGPLWGQSDQGHSLVLIVQALNRIADVQEKVLIVLAATNEILNQGIFHR